MSIEIWSVVVCPWCAIGKANLDAAAEKFTAAAGGRSIEVTWRSFELDPAAPRERQGPYLDLISRKYGTSREQAQQMIDRVEQMGAAAGVEINHDIAKPGNSFDAHRLVHLAADRGLQTQVKERFLRGYLTEGMAVSDHDELVAAAAEVGLDEAESRRVLAGQDYADDVRADERAAQEIGVTGVPFFVLDGRYAVPGAQSVETMVSALEQAWSTRAPQVLVGAGDSEPGEYCGPDGCS